MRRLVFVVLAWSSFCVQAQKLFSFDEEGMNRMYVEMNMRGHEVTSLSLMRLTTNELRGSLVNEFGIKAFDFVYASGKTKVSNVVSFLDKWYIKRVLKKDLSFLFSATISCHRGKRRVEKDSAGVITLTNEKYKLTYRFSPLNDATE